MSIKNTRARTAHTVFRKLSDSLSAKSVRSLVTGLALTTSSITGVAHAQQNSLQVPAYGVTQHQSIQVQRPGMHTGEAMPPVQQVQLSLDPRRPLDNRIEAMPKAEEKLEVINHRSQLIVTRNPIRRIAWSDTQLLDVVQFSPTEISLIGQGLGSTDLWLWFEGQEQPLMYVVTVVRDPDLDEQRNLNYGRIERKLSLLYPNSKVYLIPISRKIIVRGQARDAEEAANIMNLIRGEVIAQEGFLNGGDFGNGLNGGGGFGNNGAGGFQGGMNGGGIGNDFNSWFIVDELRLPGEFQIMINVRTAEIQRSQLRRLGVDWRAAINGSAAIIGSSMAGGAPNLTGVFDSGNLIIAVDLLASHGVAKILDDARLVTLSGEPAAFLSGGEFAVPTIVGVGGAQGQQTSFRGYGTSIICTPTLLDNDLIRLEIVPEVSQLNSGNSVGGIPGVNVRRVQTRVELREGQSISLGGVFSRRESAEVTRVPFLGEIPVVGTWLFNAKKATEDESEMLIIVTPEIVRPMDADQVPPLPGWYSTHPNDHDFFKYNRIEGNADLGNYQLLPYGNGQPYGQDVGYNYFNPNTATPQIAPGATGGAQGPYPNGVYGPGGPQGDPQFAPQLGPQPGQPIPQGYGPVPNQGGPGQLMEPVPMPGANANDQQRSGQVQQTSAQKPQQRPSTR
ncbi:pilus assembly protein N-terminal domain-containing protein [Planctomicrobium sp. SH527]|uniref:type II and III secretion system protein family protein n=1 Tax=Planctomicrobium sp. SH527 TaxID=3448123 RepID=UPI003F5B2839